MPNRNNSLHVGITRESSFVVRKEDTAAFLGSGDINVLSTPAMIAMMENTARLLVQEYLNPEDTTVGIKVNVSHLKAAPEGAKIRVIAKLTSIEGRKLIFDVDAYWKDTKIGTGEHERFIVNRERFLKKLMSILGEKE